MAAKTVGEYVAGLGKEQAEIISALRQIVRSAAPKAKESVKWAQPVYEDNGPFAHIRAFTPPHSYGAPYTIL